MEYFGYPSGGTELVQ